MNSLMIRSASNGVMPSCRLNVLGDGRDGPQCIQEETALRSLETTKLPRRGQGHIATGHDDSNPQLKKEPCAWPVRRNGAWYEHATFSFPLLSLSEPSRNNRKIRGVRFIVNDNPRLSYRSGSSVEEGRDFLN
jgi:hypothetical protein